MSQFRGTIIYVSGAFILDFGSLPSIFYYKYNENGVPLHEPQPSVIEVTQYQEQNLVAQADQHRRVARSPVDWNTPELHWQYRWAKASIIRSIFWASPGSRKLHRNCLHGGEKASRTGRAVCALPSCPWLLTSEAEELGEALASCHVTEQR